MIISCSYLKIIYCKEKAGMKNRDTMSSKLVKEVPDTLDKNADDFKSLKGKVNDIFKTYRNHLTVSHFL